jgi:uncharacterized Ntn-hydrolase superfamily protein
VTFSLLGRCQRTGQLGMVISSSSPAVAARCTHARPGVGVAASQNVTDPRLGPALLDALTRHGEYARAAIDEVVEGLGDRLMAGLRAAIDAGGSSSARPSPSASVSSATT